MPEGNYTMIMETGKGTLELGGINYRERIEIPMTAGSIIGGYTDLLLSNVVTITFTVTEIFTGIEKTQTITLTYQ